MSTRIRMPSGCPSCSTNWLCDLGYRFALSERVVWDKHPCWVCCLEKVRPRSCLANAGSVSIRRGEEELSWGARLGLARPRQKAEDLLSFSTSDWTAPIGQALFQAVGATDRIMLL